MVELNLRERLEYRAERARRRAYLDTLPSRPFTPFEKDILRQQMNEKLEFRKTQKNMNPFEADNARMWAEGKLELRIARGTKRINLLAPSPDMPSIPVGELIKV